ncbi:MAG: hypothetical protein ACKVY0_26705 [Prosthecobacter sp.]|uniref:hypothetical protein n=1 Tax=Prosthecobacter sp. TaxID=1965333 RepID=UPI00390456F0
MCPSFRRAEPLHLLDRTCCITASRSDRTALMTAVERHRDTADILVFNETQEDLEEALGVLGNYVNNIAKGDPLIVEQSGFPSYETTRTQDTSPPAVPTNLRLPPGAT